jgi:prevent-host-death family protein
MDVGVRDLKKHLSMYLERAARGEVIRVTDRGEPKAMLVPLPGRLALEEGIASGWVRPPASEAAPRPVPRQRATRRTLDVLGEDREA